MISYFLLFLALQRLFGRNACFFYIEASLVLIALFPLLEYGVIHPDTKIRLIALNLTLGLQQALIAKCDRAAVCGEEIRRKPCDVVARGRGEGLIDLMRADLK